MAATRTPAEIEREIEAERSALTRSLEELQAQFTPENLVNHATSYFRENGSDFTASLTRHVRENPTAAIMAAVGVTWLISGTPATGPTARRLESRRPGRRPARGPHVDYDHRSYETVQGLNRDPDPYADFESRVDAASDGGGSDRTLPRSSGKGGTVGADASAASGWGGPRQHESGAIGAMEDDMTTGNDRTFERGYVTDDERDATWSRDMPSQGDTWRSKASAGLSDAKARARRFKGRTYAKSAELRARLTEGTEHMPEAARARVLRARQAAYEAQKRMEDAMDRYSSQGREMYDRQPLVVGLLVLGVGAAIGAMLPRTEREDRTIGVYRDRAFDEADAIFREESAKLKAVAEATLDEAKSVASEAVRDAKSSVPSGEEAVDAAEDRARNAAERVADRAKSEAEKRDLGGSLN